jgi:putative PIN family toxin of toxin-antitoxin system
MMPPRPAFDTPRLVLDANVLLSALLFRAGSLSWLRLAWQSKAVRPLASRDTAAELIRALAYPKFRLDDDERRELLADYLPWCETIVIAAPTPPELPDCRDPLDRPFLELALAAGADALVTGDRDLLALAPVFAVPILTPSELLDRLPGPTGKK